MKKEKTTNQPLHSPTLKNRQENKESFFCAKQFNTLVNWQIMSRLSPLPTPLQCPHTFGLTVEVNFSLLKAVTKLSLYLVKQQRTICSTDLPLLSKELPFPSKFMLISIKSKHLFKTRDTKTWGFFCWADPPLSISSLPKWKNIVPYVTFPYGTLNNTPLFFFHSGTFCGCCCCCRRQRAKL